MSFTKTHISRTTAAAAAVAAAAGSLGLVLGAPFAQADTSTQSFGSQGKLIDGDVVQHWTVSNLKPSTDNIPYSPAGKLWEATATDESVQGGATPIVSNLNARARSGETYRVLFGVATPQGVNPATLAQGQKTTGKVYFDVTGDKPDSVVYNSGGEDRLIWVGAPASTGTGARSSGPSRSGGGSTSTSTAPTTPGAPPTSPTPTPGAAPASIEGVPGAAGTQALPGTPPPAGSQGTPLPAGAPAAPAPGGSQGTPLPPGSNAGAPMPAAQGAPAPGAPAPGALAPGAPAPVPPAPGAAAQLPPGAAEGTPTGFTEPGGPAVPNGPVIAPAPPR